MPGWNANADTGKSDTNGYGYDSTRNTDTDSDGHGNNASGLTYTLGDPTSADAKAAAHAVSPADAVR